MFGGGGAASSESSSSEAEGTPFPFGTGGTSAPSVNESALCNECPDFMLVLDGCGLNTDGSVKALGCLALKVLLLIFSVGTWAPDQDCRPAFVVLGGGEDRPMEGTGALGKDARAFGFFFFFDLAFTSSAAFDSIALR